MKILFKSIIILFFISFSAGAMAQLDAVGDDGYRTINLQNPQYEDVGFQDILDLYEGKVVYLDFWASWCRPCKNEMPHSAKLKEQLKGKDVVFVYISSDKNETAWRNGIEELNITGDNYRSSRKVWEDYNSILNVRYIPRYVLIDKEGNIVDQNAKRPSNPEVINDIEKLL